MSSTDNRIVRMVFDNAAFKRAAEETKSALGRVNDAIDRAGKSKGLLNLNSNMKEVAINASKMQVVTTAALATIASKATIAGTNMLKSLTFDPIKSGFQEYGELLTKQNTIMNATGLSAERVKKVLNGLNTYSDKTIYSFGDMTQALTTFVNAGVPLSKASKSIQGIANASAFAGASAQESQSSFLAFSQSLSAGFLGLQDWRQASVTGKIGTVTFKNELLKAAAAQHLLTKRGDEYVTKKGTRISATKGFDQSLREQWASATVLNQALGVFADRNGKLGKKAFDAAQKVRTFGAFMDTLKESLGSGWAGVFGALFGGLDDATNMWTSLSQSIGKVVSAFFNFLTASLQVWRNLGGATQIGDALKNAFSPIAAIFTVLGKAFHNAFGGKGGTGMGSTLYGISVAIKVLTLPLLGLSKIILLLETPLTLFFQTLRIGGLIIGGMIKFVIDFVKAFISLTTFKMPSTQSTDNIVGWLIALGKAIASAVSQFKDLIKGGASISDAFSSIHFGLPDLPNFKNWFKGIKLPSIKFPAFDAPSLPKFGGFGLDLPGIFGGGKSDDQSSKVQELSTKVMELTSNSKSLDYVMQGLSENSILHESSDRFQGVVNIRNLEQGMDAVSIKAEKGKNILGQFWDFIKKIGSAIGTFLGKIQGDDVVTATNFAILGTMGLMFARFIQALTKGITTFKDIGNSAKGVLDSTSSALKSFQTVAKAQLIKTIAISLLLLAAALVVLAFIPRDKLITALMGMAGVVAALSIIMLIFTKTIKSLDGKKVTMKLYALGFAIAAVGLGMLFLAAAMLIMQHVDNKTIVKTLLTLVVIFKALEQFGNLGDKAGRKILAAAISIGIIGASLIILATAMLLFKLVDYKSMAKAGAVITVLTLALLLLGSVPASRLAKSGTAILAIAVSMLILANALIIFARIDWQSILKAGVVLAGLTLALILMSGVGIQGAAVIVAVGAAMLAIAMACLIFNKVNWKAIAMAAVVMGILVLAFAAMLAVITVFAPAVALLTTLALGLAALAAAAALLAFAFALVLPLLAVGAAGFAAFATAAAVAIAVFLQTLAAEMPNIKKSLDKILRIFVDFVVEATPVLLDGLLDMLDALLNATPRFLQQLITFVGQLITGIIKAIGDWTIDLVNAGVDLILALIKGISEQAPKLTSAAIDLILAFIKSFTDNVFKLVNGAIAAFSSFLHQLADSIRSGAGELGAAIGDVVEAMVELGPRFVAGLAKGIAEAPLQGLTDAVTGIVNHIPGVTKLKGLIHSPSRLMIPLGKFFVDGLAKGIQDNAAAVIVATAGMVTGVIATAMEYISSYVQKLDQMGIAARAKAEGLAEAAKRAADAASKTEKNKKDDAAAAKLQTQADQASTAADKAEEKAQKAKDAANRQKEFEQAATLDKAKMKSEDAQTAIDDAKAAEAKAAKDVVEARALEAQSKSGKYSSAESKRMLREADKLREDAKKEAKLANAYLNTAKQDAAQALALQKQAGAEAAASYQKQFDAAAQGAADSDAFDALSDAEKATKRRADAAELQRQSQENLAKAKVLAYTDIDAANTLAGVALDQADQARQYLKDAVDYDKQVADAAAEAAQKAQDEQGQATDTVTPTVDLTASSQAALAFANLQDIFDSATAAAATDSKVEFNQYNTSPESLSPTEVYRQTNNLLTHAYDKLGKAA
jgi:hypothetical protein